MEAHIHMPVRITAHLRRLASDHQEIAAQYLETQEAQPSRFKNADPLGEEESYSPRKGLIHKYSNRLLWKVSYRCAAHCRFCTRLRQIGSSDGDLSADDIATGLEYVASHAEIDDVILSGGDPLFTPDVTRRILHGLSTIPTVKVIRIGTRMPVQSPESIRSKLLLELFEDTKRISASKPLFLLIHINHPSEITPSVREIVSTLKSAATGVLSQTVFLRGINDDSELLASLFRELYYLGILPYYIYRCDEVQGLERFICDLDKEREIMTDLTSRLSGLCSPTYVVDVAGKGKLPIPLKYWDVPSIDRCKDFDGRVIAIAS